MLRPDLPDATRNERLLAGLRRHGLLPLRAGT